MATARQRKRLHGLWAGKSRQQAATMKAADESQPAAHYNGTAQQRECIRQVLLKRGPHGASVAELTTACAAPSVTKRVSELRRAGLDIESRADAVIGPHGVNAVARYVLLEPTSRQGELDLQFE